MAVAGADPGGGADAVDGDRADPVRGGAVAELADRFDPQQWTLPSPSSAQVWNQPAVTAVAVLMPWTAPGVIRSVVVPSPSWPKELLPQQRTVPSARSAQVCASPALTSVTVGVVAAAAAPGPPSVEGTSRAARTPARRPLTRRDIDRSSRDATTPRRRASRDASREAPSAAGRRKGRTAPRARSALTSWSRRETSSGLPSPLGPEGPVEEGGHLAPGDVGGGAVLVVAAAGGHPGLATRLMLGSWMLCSSSVKASGAVPASLRARARNEAICSRDTRAVGQYLVAAHPVAMPAFATRLMLGSWGLASSSVKASGAVPVSLRARARNVAICSRVT